MLVFFEMNSQAMKSCYGFEIAVMRVYLNFTATFFSVQLHSPSPILLSKFIRLSACPDSWGVFFPSSSSSHILQHKTEPPPGLAGPKYGNSLSSATATPQPASARTLRSQTLQIPSETLNFPVAPLATAAIGSTSSPSNITPRT